MTVWLFHSKLLQVLCCSLSGAVGGQPDVLSSVDVNVTAERHVTADVQRHSSAADSPTLLLQQNTASLTTTVRTVATVESADKTLAAASLHTTADTSLPHQPVDPSQIPIRYYLMSLTTPFSFLFN